MARRSRPRRLPAPQPPRAAEQRCARTDDLGAAHFAEHVHHAHELAHGWRVAIRAASAHGGHERLHHVLEVGIEERGQFLVTLKDLGQVLQGSRGQIGCPGRSNLLDLLDHARGLFKEGRARIRQGRALCHGRRRGRSARSSPRSPGGPSLFSTQTDYFRIDKPPEAGVGLCRLSELESVPARGERRAAVAPTALARPALCAPRTPRSPGGTGTRGARCEQPRALGPAGLRPPLCTAAQLFSRAPRPSRLRPERSPLCMRTSMSVPSAWHRGAWVPLPEGAWHRLLPTCRRAGSPGQAGGARVCDGRPVIPWRRA